MSSVMVGVKVTVELGEPAVKVVLLCDTEPLPVGGVPVGFRVGLKLAVGVALSDELYESDGVAVGGVELAVAFSVRSGGVGLLVL